MSLGLIQILINSHNISVKLTTNAFKNIFIFQKSREHYVISLCDKLVNFHQTL